MLSPVYPTNVTLASASPTPLRHRNYSSLDFSVFIVLGILRGELLLFYLRVFQRGDTLEGGCLWRPWTPVSARQSRSMADKTEGEAHALSARDALCFLFPPLPCFLELRSFNSAGSISFSSAVIVCSFLPVNCLFPCSLYW